MFKMAILSKGIRLYYSYFKELDLKSIKNDEVFKVLKSSGTSGNLSKIFLLFLTLT